MTAHPRTCVVEILAHVSASGNTRIDRLPALNRCDGVAMLLPSVLFRLSFSPAVFAMGTHPWERL
jgi:hypothetical protein